MCCLVNRSCTYNHICLAFKYRTHNLLNVFSTILVVRIGINDDISALLKTLIKSCHEAFGKSLVSLKVDNIVDAPALSNLNRVIFTSIIDYKILYLVYAINVLWQIVKSNLKGFRFIITRNLYN